MRMTINDIQNRKDTGEKIPMVTAYDYTGAKLVSKADIPLILVGDSLGQVVLGHDSTIPVTMDDMVRHTQMVVRGTGTQHIVSDMPFMSYSTPVQALGNAARLVSEGGAHVVKIEGGSELSETVKLITRHGIPVCGHLGLTPQSIHKLGGLSVQAATSKAAKKLEKDALSLQEAGASCLVVECIPSSVAANVTKLLDIPVIGIGAGIDCDGQVLVLYDILGLTPKQPKFSKNFLSEEDSISDAIKKYVERVKNNSFPSESNSYE